MRLPGVKIELRHLRYFLAVSEELNFRRAAERLNMAQPPLSQAIRKLEAELGVQLLHRTSRAVTPTEAGLVFANEGRKVLASFDRAVAEARRAGGAVVGLRVGCIPTLPVERLLEFLDALAETIPGPRPVVTHLLSLEQVERLRSGDLDVAVIRQAGELDGIEVEPVFAGEPLAAFLSPRHRLAERDVLAPDDFTEEALVTFPRETNPALYDHELELLERAGYRFRSVVPAGAKDVRDILLAVGEGAGVALLPASVADGSGVIDLVRHRPLEPPVSTSDTAVAWLAEPSARILPFVSDLHEIARNLRGREGGTRGSDRT
jgi:DNA-binding transcriptional LysR family regulator